MPSLPLTPRFAVFGQPIAHSKSPVIHQHFGKALGLSLDYQAIELSPENLSETLGQMHIDGLHGANITLPLKELAARVCIDLSPAARYSGAVNTLIRKDKGWFGDNTDGIGLVRDLQRLDTPLKKAHVLLLGAGGASRGVVPALFEAGVGRILVANRSLERAHRLVMDMAECGDLSACGLNDLAEHGPFDVILNATSASRQGPPLTLGAHLATTTTVAYDLSYGESAQAFLAWAKGIGVSRCADGLGMLVEQAAEAFQRWHGIRPETATVLAALRASNR